jgi:hypothetical protein
MARLEIGTLGSKTGAIVVVTLSRRNLLALLHKLEMPGSARMLTNGDCYVDGEPVSDHVLILRVEEDDEHYAKRPEPAGPVHPATERFLRERS